MKMVRVLILCVMAVPLCGCLMNWYHPFRSEYVRSTMKAAADRGDSDALYQLGDAHCCGDKGGYYDTEKAMAYWCQAAKQDHVPSQLALGKLYENSYKIIGNTIPKNDLKAYTWYSVAASKGSQEAAELKRYLEQTMTPENLERAKEMAAHWRETRCVLLEDPKGPWDPEWVRQQEEAAEKAAMKDFAKPQPSHPSRRRR